MALLHTGTRVRRGCRARCAVFPSPRAGVRPQRPEGATRGVPEVRMAQSLTSRIAKPFGLFVRSHRLGNELGGGQGSMIQMRATSVPKTLVMKLESQPGWGAGLVVRDLPLHWELFFDHGGERKFVKSLATTSLVPITISAEELAALETKAYGRHAALEGRAKRGTRPRSSTPSVKGRFASFEEQLAFFEQVFPGGFGGERVHKRGARPVRSEGQGRLQASGHRSRPGGAFSRSFRERCAGDSLRECEEGAAGDDHRLPDGRADSVRDDGRRQPCSGDRGPARTCFTAMATTATASRPSPAR